MKKNDFMSLLIYFIFLIFLSSAIIIGSIKLGKNGKYLAQGYMLTPALAALFTRTFFYGPGFKDANLHFGKINDYIQFWVLSLIITIFSYVLFTLFGSISWDFSGNVFLSRLSEQFAATGKNINDTLPGNLTPKMMLIIFFIGGLTIFNIIPGILTGIGEEFGHRGFMFPLLYRFKPWVGLFIGGLLWYAWHLPLAMVIPKTIDYPLWKDILNFIILGIGAVCTFIYLSYIYIKSKSIFVVSIGHIVLNNSAGAFSYFVVIKDQFTANMALSITMLVVVLVIYFKNEFIVFNNYFKNSNF